MEEEGGVRRGWPATSGGRMEEEGGARRGRPAVTRGRTEEEEAGTESSKEDEVTAAQIGGGATGEDRRRGGSRGRSSECV